MNERGPDFEDLVGPGLEPAERKRLLRVHELLVAAGPPPELPSDAGAPVTDASQEPPRRVPAPRSSGRVRWLPARRRGALVAVAAAFAVLLFAAGVVVGQGRDGPGTFDSVAMSGTSAAQGASATLQLFDADAAGNWPMEMRVSGLQPLASGAPYELWLTREGELSALCGSFRVDAGGSAVVPMNAPYKLKDFDGWVVVGEGSTEPLLTT